MADDTSDLLPRARWWSEREVLLLLALVGGIYFTRIDYLPIRGEETRRARIACEILESGDWIVPRQQGEPFTSRPPLGNWPIAWSIAVAGDCTTFATRLPTVLATLLTTLLVYGYSRNFLPRLGSLAAAASYATMGLVMQMGQVAETDATFTLLLAGSLLCWHWNFAGRQAPWTAWLVGYGLAGLATLTKGPQAPAYFAAAAGMYLFIVGQWRELLRGRHLAGLALFLAIVGAWQIPFLLRLGWPAVHDVWAKDVAMRFEDRTWHAWLLHLCEYPLEIAACLVPWSLLLTAWTLPELRRDLGRARPAVMFAMIGLLVTFPTCWLVTGAKGRYYMPLFPLVAVLVGAAVQRLSQSAISQRTATWWRSFVGLMALVAVAAGGMVLISSLAPRFGLAMLAQPAWFAVVYGTAAVAAAVLLLRWRGPDFARRAGAAVLTLASFFGLSHTGVELNAQAARSERAEEAVAELKQQLPDCPHLVSFGPIENMFAFHYKQTIPLANWPSNAKPVPPDLEYFCFNHEGDEPIDLPFAWRKLAVISCDRNHYEQPIRSVIVGQRLPAGEVVGARGDGTIRR